MSVSGLVITLSRDPADAGNAIKSLRMNQRLVVGDLIGRHLALAAETHSREEDLALLEDLRSTAGVEQVEIVFIGLDEPCRRDSSRASSEQSSRISNGVAPERLAPTGSDQGPNSAVGIEP